jgi:heme/copper-type cytochrome/quinol oxidase subunit 4
VAFAGLIVTALFPTDLETAPSTRTGDIHAISFLVNIVSILLSTICLALSYAADPRWHARKGAALVLAGLLIAAFVAQYLTLHKGAPYGITNRLFVVVLIAWLIVNSLWLKAATSPGRREQRA